MAYRVRHRNEMRGTSEESAETYAQKLDAFDAACDTCVSFIKANSKENRSGDLDYPPSEGSRYKIWVELRSAYDIGMQLRYDFYTGSDWETNQLDWQVVEST